jgi:WD40 repeat protein
MTFSADSRTLLVGRSDGLLLLYDIATGNELQREQFTKSVRSCGFLADGRHYFAGNDDKTLRIFETDSGNETFRFDADSHCTQFTALSPDGRTIASGGGLFRVDGTSDVYKTDGDFAVRVWSFPESLWPESSTTETATLEAAAK